MCFNIIEYIILLYHIIFKGLLAKGREVFSYLTLQSLQQGPDAHSASVVNLQVIGSQQGSYALHSSIGPQSHCSPSSITLFPHNLLISNYNPKQIPNRLRKR